MASHRAAWVWGKPSCCLKEDQISSQLVAWCYINSGMRHWHPIWTESAAEEILHTIPIPCSFKSTAPLLRALTNLLAWLPSEGPPEWTFIAPLSSGSIITALLIRLPGDSLPQLQDAGVPCSYCEEISCLGRAPYKWQLSVCLPVKKKDLQRCWVTCYICFTPCFLYCTCFLSRYCTH